MWGTWFWILASGVLVVLLLIGLAFGTSIAFFGIVIAAGLVFLLALVYGARRGSQTAAGTRAPRSRRPDASPASGEGSAPTPSEPPPWQAP